MDWSEQAEQMLERIETRRVFQLTLAALEPGSEDAEWLHKQLDLVFEGRHDYVRGPRNPFIVERR